MKNGPPAHGRAVFHAGMRYSMYLRYALPFVGFTFTTRTSRPTDARMAAMVRRSVSVVISMGMRV